MEKSRKYTILDFAYDVLNESDTPLTFQKIWESGKDESYADKLSFSGKTP